MNVSIFIEKELQERITEITIKAPTELCSYVSASLIQQNVVDGKIEPKKIDNLMLESVLAEGKSVEINLCEVAPKVFGFGVKA